MLSLTPPQAGPLLSGFVNLDSLSGSQALGDPAADLLIPGICLLGILLALALDLLADGRSPPDP